MVCYKKLPKNTPKGIEFLSAADYMSETDFQAMLAVGVTQISGFVALMSDYMRLEAAAGQTQHDFVWVVDCDTLWLQNVSTVHRFLHHAFGTYAVNKQSRQNIKYLDRMVQLTMDYCVQPRDFKKIATPWMFPRGFRGNRQT